MPKISLIIPVLNEAKMLQGLLHYLKACDPENNLEIIVVDGKSTDATCAIAKHENVLLKEAEISCRAHQMNLGARAATTDILYFVHADVRPPQDFVQQILGAHKRGVEMAFFKQKFDKMNILLWFNSFFTRYKRLWCRGGDQTIYITRDLFSKLKGYDEKYIIMEEYDLLHRAQKISDYEILKGHTIVSSRKYSTNSWFKVMTSNLRAVRQFKKGVDPKLIRKEYSKRLNPY
jgi:rSAM/selenodomain-associated transferase 2